MNDRKQNNTIVPMRRAVTFGNALAYMGSLAYLTNANETGGAKLDGMRRETDAWEDVTRGTDFLLTHRVDDDVFQ